MTCLGWGSGGGAHEPGSGRLARVRHVGHAGGLLLLERQRVLHVGRLGCLRGLRHVRRHRGNLLLLLHRVLLLHRRLLLLLRRAGGEGLGRGDG